jgi:hypothetical protein
MYAVGAYTGDGKTTLRLQGARKLCKEGARVGYCSMEMPERDLRNGLVAHRGDPALSSRSPGGSSSTRAMSLYAKRRRDRELEPRHRVRLRADGRQDRRTRRDREWDAVIVDHIHRFGWGRARHASRIR